MKESEVEILMSLIDKQLQEMHKTFDSALSGQLEEIYKLGRRVDAIEAQVTEEKRKEQE